jgi:hypothetical protein
MSPVKIVHILQIRNKEKPTFHIVQRLTRANCYLKNLKKTTFYEKKFKNSVLLRKMAIKSEKKCEKIRVSGDQGIRWWISGDPGIAIVDTLGINLRLTI